MNAPIKFWSYSALKRFEKCAYEIYLDRVMKNPKPEIVETSPLERGNRVHKAAEAYVKGEGQLVGELGIFASEFERLKEAYGTGTVQVEDSWWFKRDWSESDWEDPDKWAIIKCDVVEWVSQTHMDVTDWKTGKSFGNEVSHDQQMMLYAIAAFMKYAALNTVRVKLGYLDEAPPIAAKITTDRKSPYSLNDSPHEVRSSWTLWRSRQDLVNPRANTAVSDLTTEALVPARTVSSCERSS